MTVAGYLLMAMGLPLVGFLLLVFLGRRLGRLAGPVATALVMGSLGLSIAALVTWVAKDAFNQAYYVESASFRWLTLPAEVSGGGAGGQPAAPVPDVAAYVSRGISVGYFIDSLTLAMFVMVTLIASLVHLFSIAYMAEDPRRSRYFAYLGLFCFGMLGVILSNSLLQMFVFWQIAGAASYLLIGFWFERRGPATGAFKSVLVNAVGDGAFLLGIGVLVLHVGAAGLSFFDAQGGSLADRVRSIEKPSAMLTWTPAEEGGEKAPPQAELLTAPPPPGVGGTAGFWAVEGNASQFLSPSTGGLLGLHWLTWVGLLLFAGAAAKAAQFPLHVWLADAMEAPASAAALIYGATFVSAGVYLVARIYPILTMDAHLAIAIIGCITLLMGALLAVLQTNVRHLLAYSTMSQLGYMMLFLGTGGYTAGLSHVFTHAFFNACLFLGVASVTRSLGGNDDLRQMGGLWRKLPLTAVGMGLAGLALIGAPFFSGAYSRGLGLVGVYDYAHAISTPKYARAAMLLFYVPALTSFVTAFYAGRCWWLIFGGKSRNEDLAEQANEPFLMVLPIGILALLSLNFYEFFWLPNLIGKSLPNLALGGPPVIRADHLAHSSWILGQRGGAYAMWAFLGVIPAVVLYYRGLGAAERLRRLPVVNLLYIWLREKMFFDAVYEGILLRAVLLASVVAGFADRYVLGGLTRLAGFLVRAVGRLSGDIDQRFVDGAAKGVGRLTEIGSGVVGGREGNGEG